MHWGCDMYGKLRIRGSAISMLGRVPGLATFIEAALLVWLLVDSCPAWGRDKQPALPPPPAAADATASNPSAPPGPNAPMRAFWAYARERFEQGDYVAAAEALEQAYAREPVPKLLYNAGQAYRKASRYPEAIRAYERFLRVADPKLPIALDAADYIRTMRLLISQEERQKKIELAMEQTQEELERFRKPPVYKRVWFWATLVGAAATAVAVGVGIKVYQDQRTTDTGMLSLQF